MMRRHVVIVGNGAAAVSALETFRSRDRDSRVTVVSGESCPAYSRVLLPYFLRRTVPYGHLFIRDLAFYRDLGAELVLGRAVERVDVGGRRLELADGGRLSFDGLLLAPGSHPVKPPIPGLEGPEVHHLWRLDEARSLDGLFREGARALVLGSGFVALQAAWAARQRGLEVTVVELAERILPQVLDAAGADLLHRRMSDAGVEIHTGTRTDGVERDGRGILRVYAEGLSPVQADVVIVGTGVRPNDQLLPECREPGTHGLAVDAGMATAAPGVFAAGDVARGPVAGGGPHQIHALWPTAVEQGRVAGANLAGAGVAYSGSLRANVTSMFGLTVASVGLIFPEEGDVVVSLDGLPGILYFTVVVRGDVPVGAVALGGAGAAIALGRLCPSIRRGRPVADVRAVVAGLQLVRTVERSGSADRPGPGWYTPGRADTIGPPQAGVPVS